MARSSLRRRFLVPAITLCALALSAISAPAQEGSGGEEEEALELQDVAVTGSRLRGVVSGSPILVLTMDDIKRRGLGSVEDVIRSLPQNFSEINAAGALDNSIVSIDAQGQSMVNLRGFGEQSTLILVNGRRWPQASSFGNGSVNVNGIPFAAIERVEVLTDGASAIYGADAQAGVLNFILRDDYEGGETRARYDMGANEGDSWRFEQNLATTWDSGRASLSLSYSETTAINAAKAGNTTLDFTSRGGQDGRTPTDAPWLTGQPGVVGYGIPLGFYNFVLQPLGALPAGNDGTNGVYAALSTDNLVPYDAAATDVSLSPTHNGERLSGHLTVNQELMSGALELFGEFTFDFSDSWATRRPVSYAGVVPATNPYNDIPAHPFLDTVVSYNFIQEASAGIMDPISNDSDQDNRRITLGVDFDLPFRDWVGEFTASRGKEGSWYLLYDVDAELLAQRVAGVDDQGNPLPIDEVINPFGNGTAQSPAAVADLVKPFFLEGDPFNANWNFSIQENYLLSANGALFDLPGGSARLAAGAEHRTERLDYSEDDSRGNIFLITEPEQEITSFFMELGVPLVGQDNRLPGFHSLGFKVAFRSDDYSFSGPFDGLDAPSTEKTYDRISPKYELAWYPVRSLKLRASLGESFAPPDSNTLFRVAFGPYNFYGIRDPLNPDAGVLFPDTYSTGNPDLEPEIAETLSMGFEWQPGGMLEGLFLSVTWLDTEFTNKFGSSGFLAFSYPELFVNIPGALERDANGNIVRMNVFTINIAQRYSEALDVNFRYQFDSGEWGYFTFGAEGTLSPRLSDVLAPGLEPDDLHGTYQGPERWKGRVYLDWSQASTTLNLTANYSSSYINGGFFGSPQDRVDNYLTFDLTGSYEFGDSGWKVFAGARNVTNRPFPFFDGFGQPWDPRRVDTRGRIIHLELRKNWDFF
ncbi:TonB-dependent receptor domain-containing protein [Candidatus Foliamicus sp.]